MPPSAQMQMILFLASNPSRAAYLRLDEEARLIQENIRRAPHRALFDFRVVPGARPADLDEELEQLRPRIVHFSGHGRGSSTSSHGGRETALTDSIGVDGDRGLFMCGTDPGEVRLVDAEMLRDLFVAHQAEEPRVRVAVFNACYSEHLLDTMSATIDAVIGIDGAIQDEAAVTFSATFYRSLAHGRTVVNAFERGRSVMGLQGFRADAPRPILRCREGFNPETRLTEACATVADIASETGISVDEHSRPSANDLEEVHRLLQRFSNGRVDDSTKIPDTVEELVGSGNIEFLPVLAQHALEDDAAHLVAPLLRLEATMSEGRWPSGLSRVAVSLNSSLGRLALSFSATICGVHETKEVPLNDTPERIDVGFDATLRIQKLASRLRVSLEAGAKSPLRGQSLSIRQGLDRLRRRLTAISSGSLGPIDEDKIILLDEFLPLTSLESDHA